MSNLTILSKNNCVQCNSTYRALGKRGVDADNYSVINMDENPDALAFAQNTLGALQAPVVIFHEGTWEDVMSGPDLIETHWTGFRPDKVNWLAEQLTDVVA